MTTYEKIKTAIANKQSVSFKYDGLIRHMSPHIIGTKKGGEQALFYQFGGESNSGIDKDKAQNNWRCLPLNKIEDLVVNNPLEVPFQTALNHLNPKVEQTCIDDIDVEVTI